MKNDFVNKNNSELHINDKIERKLLKAEEQIEQGKTIDATEVFKELETLYEF